MSLKTLLYLCIATAIIIMALLLIRSADESSNTSNGPITDPSDSSARDEVLERAREFRPDGMCTQVMTPAVHETTGARYTFPTGCLPDGWVREE